MRNKLSFQDLMLFCGDLCSEDGLNPKYSPKRYPRASRHRKSYQLCAQIAQALRYFFAGESQDEILSSLQVVQVIPAPTASRLSIQVVQEAGSLKYSPSAIQEALQRKIPSIRYAVSQSIQRKKTPHLSFIVVI